MVCLFQFLRFFSPISIGSFSNFRIVIFAYFTRNVFDFLQKNVTHSINNIIKTREKKKKNTNNLEFEWKSITALVPIQCRCYSMRTKKPRIFGLFLHFELVAVHLFSHFISSHKSNFNILMWNLNF